METGNVNYQTLVQITKAISTIRDPEEIVLITVEGVHQRHECEGVRAVALQCKVERAQVGWQLPV